MKSKITASIRLLGSGHENKNNKLQILGKKLVQLFVLVLAINANSQNTNFIWARNFGTIQGESMNTVVDAAGNTYTSGVFEGTGDFDSSANTSNLTSVNQIDVHITKYDDSGNFIWAKSFGSYLRNSGYPPISLALDSSGNVYATGCFRGTNDFNPGTGVANLTSVPFSSIFFNSTFILKLDTNGDFVWAKNILGGGGNSGAAIKIDTIGNIIIGGICSNLTDLDPSVGTAVVSSSNISNNYILKLNALGEYIWSKNWTGSGSTATIGITLDSNNDIISTGVFKETMDFDPSDTAFNLTSNGGDDIFISKFESSGNFVWAKSVGGIDNDVIRGITIDLNNNLCLTGNFWSTVDFDTSSNVFNLTADTTLAGISVDSFILKLNASGDLVWAKKVGAITNFEDDSRAIAVDNLGNVYTTGILQDAVAGGTDMDPGSGVFILIGTGDAYYLKLDANGNFVWAFNYSGVSSNRHRQANSINVTNLGVVYSAGKFGCPTGGSDFDFSTGISLLSCGSRSFLLKFNQSTLGVLGNQLSKLSLYPNPTTKNLNLTFEKNLENANIKIISILGQIVLEKSNISGLEVNVDVSGLTNEIYLVQVIDGYKIMNSKFIKE